MSTVDEIEQAVSRLSADELAAFRSWFADFDAGIWDRKFAEDVENGRLDELAEEALCDLNDGHCTDL